MRKRDATLIFLGSIVLSVVLIVGYLFVFDQPHRQAAALTDVTEIQRAEIESSNRRINAEIVAGILLALTVGATLWRVKVADKTAEATRQSAEAARKTAEAAQQTAQASLQSQINERFTRAIELFAQTSLEARLGGIYSLERIAQESKEHHWPIMETLTAYVREHAPVRDPDEAEPTYNTDTGDLTTEERPNPKSDIDAILRVIGRRNTKFDPDGGCLDLDKTDLQGARLGGAPLRGASFGYANLSRAVFVHANLSSAYLKGTNLQQAEFQDADMAKAFLWEADLSKANLSGSTLTHAYLSDANLTNATLIGADLREAFIGTADLTLANFERSNLSGADLQGARTYETSLLDADLSDVNLEHTMLVGHVRGSDLTNARLFGADLRYAKGLTVEQVKASQYHDSTKLPPEIQQKLEAEGLWPPAPKPLPPPQ